MNGLEGRDRHRPPRGLGRAVALLLVAALTLTAGCSRLPLPGRPSAQASPRPAALTTSAPSGRLQELAPPGAVQQFNGELEQRQPRLQIDAPADGALLPAGPWTLSLTVEDWPLVDAGDLGLGSHVVVQVDDGPPQHIAQASATASGERVELQLPELSPGSHRISAFAARPWGEAVKRPGAFQQIQVHRVAATPQTQPAAGSAQLIAVSPGGPTGAEPVLIDWLLRDAPLQGLREGDGRWRLRITINGDSFLVDQNSPLWLKGFRSGSNSVVLELLDGLGEPLNPPFNTAVREVVIDPRAPRSPWLQNSLRPEERLRLLGQAPASAMEKPQPPQPSGEPETIQPKRGSGGSGPEELIKEDTTGAVPEATAEPEAADDTVTPGPAAPGTADPSAATGSPSADGGPRVASPLRELPSAEPATPARASAAGPEAERPTTAVTPTQPASASARPPEAIAEPATTAAPTTAAAAATPTAKQEPEPALVPEPETSGWSEPAPPSSAGTVPQPETAPTATAPPTITQPDTVIPDPSAASRERDSDTRLRPSSNLGGSARELVREDGSLIRSEPQGWLGNLRGRLQR